MSQVALIIIYNHQYNRNIDVLENLYKDRFSDIYHLVPFYSGDRSNVIPVYDSSYYFQGYISQGLSAFWKKRYQHYFFLGDDLILNPSIDENNYMTYLGLNAESSFIPELKQLHKVDDFWHRIGDAFQWNINRVGVEAQNQIPSPVEALVRFEHHNIDFKPLQFHQIWHPTKRSGVRLRKSLNKLRYSLRRFFAETILKKEYPLPYPLIGGYSDIFVISSASIKAFSHYCGVFAVTQLFVEIAIPTSIILASNHIVTEENLPLRGRALWTNEDYKILLRYQNSLDKLLLDFPKGYLYLHPIKLSQWKSKK